MHTWKTNGAINWTGDNAKQIDCDFSCKGGFKYHNTGKNRGCSACEIGEWTPNDNQLTTCNQCTNKPNDPKAYYIGVGTSADCPWACKDGYKKAGGKCVKGEKKNWVNCTPSCNSSCTRTRTVTCFDGNGISVPLSLCHGSDTATSEVVP